MYTSDEFNEENQGGYSEEQSSTSYDSGNKTKLIFIVALVIVLIILIVLVLSKKGVFKKEDHYVLNVSPESVVVSYGGTKNIAYEVRNNDELVPNATVTFTVEDEEVATVDNNNVTGVSYGKTGIYAVYKDQEGKTVQKYVEVTVADGDPNTPITNVVFPNGDLQMPVNSTYDIVLGIEPTTGFVENKKFRSSNNNIVTVDSLGKLTAISEGEATIKIDVNNSAFTKGLKVYVNNKSTVPSLIINPTKITIGTTIEKIVIGDSKELEYAVEPDNADKSNIVWSSSNTGVLTIDDNGKITGIKEGSATIKAEAPNGVGDSIKIKVEKSAVEITEITLDSTEISLTTGETQTIAPTIVPDDATDKTLTYTSSNSAVATVESNMDTTATITAVAAGSATITIKSSNNIEKTIQVTVSDAAPIDPGSSGGSSGGGGGGSSCKKTCPAGQYVSNCKCVTCEAGYYCRDGKKNKCSSGYSSKAGASSCTRSSCPAGSYLDSSHSTGCRTCPSGKYCSGGTAMPKTCANGKIPNSGKTGCQNCSIANCVTYGGGGTSCTCTKCQTNYVTQGSSCKYVGSTATKPCASRGTVGECNASSNCKWDYTYGCRNK